MFLAGYSFSPRLNKRDKSSKKTFLWRIQSFKKHLCVLKIGEKMEENEQETPVEEEENSEEAEEKTTEDESVEEEPAEDDVPEAPEGSAEEPVEEAAEEQSE